MRLRSRIPIICLGLLAALALPASAQSPAPPRSLTLEDALGLAVPASEAVALARIGMTRAQGTHLQARSALFPQISGSVSYTRQLRSQFDALFGAAPPDTTTGPPRPTSCPPFAPNPNLPIDRRLGDLEAAVECATTVDPFAGFSQLPFGRKNTYSLGLSGSQVLFDGGRTFGQMKAADAGRVSAAIGLTATEAQLVLDVVQAYYDAALSDRLVAIANSTLAQADSTLRQTVLRREVGTVPEFDVLRARVARDNQRPLVIQARTRRDLAYVRLKQLLNLSLEEPVTLETTLDDTALASTPTLAQMAAAAPDTAPEHRAAVRQAAEAIRAQEGLDAASRAARLPSVVLTSQWSRFAYPSRGLPGWNEFLTDWSLSIGLSVPIFTGGRIKGDRIAAQANLDEAKVRHRQLAEAAQIDARNALAELEAADAAWIASEGTAAQATRAYEIAELRFQEGLSTQTELLDARIALQQAEVNRAQASRDLQIARVRVGLLADLPLAGSLGATSNSAGSSAAATTSRFQ